MLVGIAVSAGELEEEQAKALADTKQELQQALSSLHTARDENQQLRARIAALEQGRPQEENDES